MKTAITQEIPIENECVSISDVLKDSLLKAIISYFMNYDAPLCTFSVVIRSELIEGFSFLGGRKPRYNTTQLKKFKNVTTIFF